MFIVELTTTTGKVCERFATCEEARRRVELFPAEGLVGLPLIFEELPDGSQRLVREDGKPLQWHRLPADGDAPPAPEAPLALAELPPDFVGGVRPVERPPAPEWDEDDLPWPEGLP